jgi:hypothetical protein
MFKSHESQKNTQRRTIENQVFASAFVASY